MKIKKVNQLNEADDMSKYVKKLKDIDTVKNYYVGYIKRKEGKKLYAWSIDGIYTGFGTHEEVLKFIKEIKSKGILDRDIDILSKKEYDKMNKERHEEG